MNKRIKKILIISGSIILVVWLLLFLLKGWLLDIAVSKMQYKLKDSYHLDLTIKNYKLNGWTEVELSGINLRDANHDTVARMAKASINIKIWPLIRGKIRLDEIMADGGMVNIGLLKKLRHHKKEVTETKDTTKLAKVQKLLSLANDLADAFPENLHASKIEIRYNDSTGNLGGYLDSISYVDSRIAMVAAINMKGQKQNWKISGTFNKSNLNCHLNVSSNITGFYELSMIKQLAKAQFGFKSFTIDISQVGEQTDNVSLKGAVSAEKVLVYNPRLSTDTITMPSCGMAFSVKLTDKNIILDSTSRLNLNDLSIRLSSDYAYRYPGHISAIVDLPMGPAMKIIDAMPGGAFELARTINLEGEMGYHLNFYLNIDNKDSIKIDASVPNQGLKILSTGIADLRKLNGNFTYHPYNSNRPILVDSTNPSYTPLHSMPQQLKDAVVGSEDPNFFFHRGIEPSAIEASFLKNMQNGSFRQGGSTISMQLVKNVFLTHKKTIDRKLEEFFLVWLLENMHLCSKNRMLEVYLNIIEWGPNVYGIGEASRFYFNKSPRDLTLNESVFLAKIIPQPLGFMHRFDEKGKLKENFQRKALNAVDRLSRRGKIDEELQGSYWPEVQITGPARNLIKIVPQMDSLRVQDSIRRANEW